MFWLKKLIWLNHLFEFVLYKLVYGKRLLLPWHSSFRFGLNIVIDSQDATVKVGNNCFFNNLCSINCLSHIEIGDNCLFGENVKIYDHNHKYKGNELIMNQGFSCAPVKIGNNCWIGSNVTILKGVTIGDNCVIGAGCIVFKNIEPNSVIINKQDLQYGTIGK